MSIEIIYIFGYGYATILGAAAILPIMQLMWSILRAQASAAGGQTKEKSLETNSALQPNFWQTATIGILERALYVASIQLGKPEFVAVWLGIKTVAQSKSWVNEKPVPGRAVYNNFLVGNGLSLLYAIMGFGIIQWGSKATKLQFGWSTVVILISPVFFSVALWIALNFILKDAENKHIKLRNRGSRKKKKSG